MHVSPAPSPLSETPLSALLLCLPCQVRAIFEAAVNSTKAGIEVHPEIMVPLVGGHAELANQEQLIRRVATEVCVARSDCETFPPVTTSLRKLRAGRPIWVLGLLQYIIKLTEHTATTQNPIDQPLKAANPIDQPLQAAHRHVCDSDQPSPVQHATAWVDDTTAAVTTGLLSRSSEVMQLHPSDTALACFLSWTFWGGLSIHP